MIHRMRYSPSAILVGLIVTAGSLYADDCSNTVLDCYPNLTIALLAALALALLIAAVWGMLVFGGWIAAPEFLPEMIAEGAEFGAGAAQGGLEADTAGAMDAEMAAAQGRLESLASEVNPMYDPATGLGTKNCSWTAREVDEALADMFAGRTPEPYAPPWYDPDDFVQLADLDTMESEYGSSFQQTSMDGIAQQLEAAGNGSRGIVYVTNGTDAHVFNAVNYGGEVFFVDGQTGEVWTSTNYLSGYGVNDDIRFMLTSG
jgi:papain fold toxin 1 (glutamine deamidase) of polymorphic toxin system